MRTEVFEAYAELRSRCKTLGEFIRENQKAFSCPLHIEETNQVLRLLLPGIVLNIKAGYNELGFAEQYEKETKETQE